MSRRPTFKQRSAKWTRWLHVYGSMFSCFIVLFFSLTGVTLNHPSWFGGDKEVVIESSGTLDRNWLDPGGESDTQEVAKLEVVEYLREKENVRGALSGFSIDETECIVAFRAPAYTADAFIDRETGTYDLVQSTLGWMAVMNDLHKGRDSGHAWSWVIDVSGIFLIFISATGLILLFYINRHRKMGLCTAVLGILFPIAIYLGLVPH